MTVAARRVTPEKVTFAAVAAILASFAAAIGYLWVQPREPAVVMVELAGDGRREGSQVYFAGEVRNSGDETAEAVQVVAELYVDGEVVAAGEQVVDFLSGGETEDIVFVFEEVPSEGELRARVTGYTEP